MDWIKKNYEYVLLTLILVVGAWLRFHNLGEISFSNDELSALKRARFDSFHEEIEKGVKVDGHPALVQLLIWAVIHVFNDNVFTIRFLFAIAGILSVYLIFLLAKRWFGTATALLSSAALATLQFPLLYSQTARPYIIGLMFTLATALFWTKILFGQDRKKGDSISYILMASACMYTHYFSLMMAGIIGLSGLFFLKKETWKNYLFCNFVVLFLFIPHINIFITQLSYGGIGSWLAPPKSDFFTKFLLYGFNDSQLIFKLFVLIFLISLILSVRERGWSKFHSICIVWYALPAIIGYYYSTHYAPVLQFSTLIFSFPFLLIFLFSYVMEKEKETNFRVRSLSKTLITFWVFIVAASGVYSTVVQNKYYQVNHFGVFKELAEKVKEWDDKYGKENITTTFTLTTPEYINYYFRKLDHQPEVSLYTNDERRDFGKFSQLIDSSKAEYFAYAWTNSAHQYETIELIQEKFPTVAERDTFFNSEIILFKRGNHPSESLLTSSDFEKDEWDKETEKQNKDVSHSGTYSQRMDEKTEYSVTYKSAIKKLNLVPGDVVKAEVWFNPVDSLENATLVIAFAKNGETVLWSGMKLNNFYKSNNKWQRAILCTPVPEDPYTEIIVYVWNPGKKTFYVDDFKVTVSKRNPLYRTL